MYPSDPVHPWIRAGLLGLPAYGVLTFASALHPQPDPTLDFAAWARFVTTDAYLVGHLLGSALGLILAVFGVFSLGALLAGTRAARLGLTGMVLSVFSHGVFLVGMGTSAFGAPATARAYLAGVDNIQALQADPAADLAGGLLLVVFITLGLVGNVLLGVAVWRSGVLPRWTGAGWLVATALLYAAGLVVGALITHDSPPTEPIGAAVVAVSGAGLVWAAWHRARAVEPATRAHPGPAAGLSEPEGTGPMTDDAAATEVLLDALDRLRATGPEFGGFLANHGPMAAEALTRIGGSEAVPGWVDRYLPRLDRAPGVVRGISDQDWPEHLGQVQLFGDWTAYLRRQAAETSWPELLRRWWPRLLPGMAASATHGVIRTAHAVRSLSAAGPVPDPLLVDELAQGLAFWAARYERLPGHPRGDGTLDAVDRHLAAAPAGSGAALRRSGCQRSAAVAGTPGRPVRGAGPVAGADLPRRGLGPADRRGGPGRGRPGGRPDRLLSRGHRPGGGPARPPVAVAAAAGRERGHQLAGRGRDRRRVRRPPAARRGRAGRSRPGPAAGPAAGRGRRAQRRARDQADRSGAARVPADQRPDAAAGRRPVPVPDRRRMTSGRRSGLTLPGRPFTLGPMGLRVIFAEDNFLVREGTAALLSEATDLELVDLVGDAEELLAAVATHRPDAVLTDIRMPPSWTDEGIQAARSIRREHPAVGVVVLSQYVEERYAAELLSEGAGGIGYLLKERIADLDQLVGALAAVAAGGSVLDPKVVESLVARRDAAGHRPVDDLSPRELEVLQAMATGRSNHAIGRDLYLSERAVEKNINQIFGKFGLGQELDVNRRVRAVITFLESTRVS